MNVVDKVKVRKVDGHFCELPEEEDLTSLYINGGLFVNMRRQFRAYMMVDGANPESKSHLKSTAQIRSEETRHLQRHYYMIHPFSQVRFKWELTMIVVYFSLFILCPLEIGMEVTPKLFLYFKFFCDIFSMIDISLFFCTGYFDNEYRRVIMNPRIVCAHYVLRHFVFDLVSSMPYNFYIQHTERYDLHNIKYIFLLKLLRVPTLIKYIKKFLIRTGSWSNNSRSVSFAIYLFLLFWWLTAANYRMLMSYLDSTDLHGKEATVFYGVLHSFHLAISQIMLVRTTNIGTDSIGVSLFNMICLCLGFILNLVIIAQLMRIYQRRMKSRNKYNNLMQEVGEYMNYKSLPRSLQKRIESYMDFKFQKNVFNEHDILHTLSTVLKHDVLLHNCKNLVEKVDFFKELPQNIILRLIAKLKTEIYLPTDMIVKAGTPGSAMYFISIGAVAVYTTVNTEICHLEDGDHFGEISLILDEPRVASVVAVTNCEVFKLNRKDFVEVVEPHLTLFNKIKTSALSRLQNTQKLMMEMEKGVKFQLEEDPL